MTKKQTLGKAAVRAKTVTVNLAKHFNWPGKNVPAEKWWQDLAARLRQQYPRGAQAPWGIPFQMAEPDKLCAIMVSKDAPAATIPLSGRASHICLLHEWPQLPEEVRFPDPTEGLVVAEYEIGFADGSRHVQPVRTRFEVAMTESPGPPWLAVYFHMWSALDPTNHPKEIQWGYAQPGLNNTRGLPLLYVLPNPQPRKPLRSLTIRGLQRSPLLVAGISLFNGARHPLCHLPRRTYRLKAPGGPAQIEQAEVDLGGVARILREAQPRGKAWLAAPHAGTGSEDPKPQAADLVEAFGAPDATVSITLKGRGKPIRFSLGAAQQRGISRAGAAALEVLGNRRQWLRVRVLDDATGKPTAVRIHFSGPAGDYLAPYGHHSQINARWFEDYGADVMFGGRSYAYVWGEFTTDLPVGDVYCEISKGFEYAPVRAKVRIRPGQRELELRIRRQRDWRKSGWVTADTHVHFISPHTAWLQAQAEGVNVVNLLASQWGRLFTNVGDYIGRVGICEDDTIVYVGTENRNHMLGHMSMLGTQGLPVYPMCCGGPSESWVGDPDFMALCEWAAENRRKGGVVIRPHYPYCGHTEDPVPIVKGLVDALEINLNRANGFPMQEWYRYLNCGYRVAVVGGTDKMGAYCALGWLRTYAKINPNRPFTYAAWAEAVRAGRTVTTSGPLLDLSVEGRQMGEVIQLPASGGALEVRAKAESFWPLGNLELVCNGRVVAKAEAPKGAASLRIAEKIKLTGSGWLAARCWGLPGHPAAGIAAHTSPVYVRCGASRAFDGPAAEHMLALVEGAIEYMNTIATVFDESARKRMVKLFKEVRAELDGRLLVEGRHHSHHGAGAYHTHGHGNAADHRH